MTDTSTEAAVQVGDLEYAKEALFDTLAAAKAARKNARYKDLTAHTVDVPAPYAKEWRLVLSAVARREHVFAIGTPRGAGGKYKAGYQVTLYGFAPDITLVLDVWQQIRAIADTGMKQSTPRAGEDTGTHRSSWLLGFRLGLTNFHGGDVDEQTAVEELISGPISASPLDVQMRSTGSGGYAGFQTARRLRFVTAADTEPEPAPADARAA